MTYTPPQPVLPAQPMPQAPRYGAAAQPEPSAPGKTLGIIAFVSSFFVQLVGLILGIVALVQSRKAGQKNGFALAAIIISSVLMVIGLVAGIVLIAVFIDMAAACAQLGPGLWEYQNGATLTCS